MNRLNTLSGVIVRWGISPFWHYIAMVLLSLGLDRLSKWMITNYMILYQSIPLIGPVVKLTYVRNGGAAFSLLANYQSPWRLILLIGVALVATVILTIVAYREQKKNPLYMYPMGLVTGGALGNLIDRATTGTVVDFIEVSYRAFQFPVFNVADSAVCIGVSWLMLLTFRNQPQRSQPAER